MPKSRSTAIAVSATLVLLAACGNDALLPVTQLFGNTMTLAFAQDTTEAPLGSDVITGLKTERPLSLTTDPIDL